MAEKASGTTKRFGVRYGRTVKQKLSGIEALSRAKYKCPYCSARQVKKKSAGIWECRKCSKVFSGKAYTVSKAKV